MATIPATYAQVITPLTHVNLSRSAAVVYGISVLSSPASASDLADTCNAAFRADLSALIDSQVTIGPSHVSWNDGSGIFSGDGTDSGNGTLSDNTCPPNVALLVRKTTAAPGRAGRGRMYLPWAATEASVTEAGAFDPAAAAVVNAAFEDWRTAMEGDDNRIVVLHAGAGTPAAVTAFSCDLRVATQRRRLR